VEKASALGGDADSITILIWLALKSAHFVTNQQIFHVVLPFHRNFFVRSNENTKDFCLLAYRIFPTLSSLFSVLRAVCDRYEILPL